MIPSSSALVSLKPARQAALQAIMTVEEARQRGARLPSMPHVRTFLRLLTGCSRINSDVARRIPGLHRDPKDRLSSLKQVEEALEMLISSHGEYCPLPLTMDVQAELFPVYGSTTYCNFYSHVKYSPLASSVRVIYVAFCCYTAPDIQPFFD